jgi:transcriptional regulator with PAS, ATPase and Fis domain
MASPHDGYDPSISETYRAVRVTFSTIAAGNPRMKECLHKARQAASSDVTVLLLGENGTGKNLIAQAVHNASPRLKGPFISVNCSSFTETLLESELFGHERGSFTGADRTRKGRFELADGGTLFLDEIAEMSPQAQAKILRAVEYKQFERVGGEETLRTDVRIIASTNRDLDEQVRKGAFRQDLFYRLNEVAIRIPPLRERKDEIPVFVDHFISEACRKLRIPAKKLSGEALDFLRKHDWPGNVRELRSVLKRGVAFSAGEEISFEDLGLEVSLLPTDLDSLEEGELSLESMERRHIQRVLRLTGGQKKKACEILGITRPTLDNKIQKYRIRL